MYIEELGGVRENEKNIFLISFPSMEKQLLLPVSPLVSLYFVFKCIEVNSNFENLAFHDLNTISTKLFSMVCSFSLKLSIYIYSIDMKNSAFIETVHNINLYRKH